MDTPGVLISRVIPAPHSDLIRLDQLVTKLITENVISPPPPNPGLKPEIAPPVREDKAKSLEKWMGFG